MKYIPLFILVCVTICVNAVNLPVLQISESPIVDDLTKFKVIEESSQLKLEQQLIYRQTFSMAYDNIDALVDDEVLKPKTWVVVFSLSSILRNTSFSSGIAYMLAIPGAKNLTCAIEKLGGHVIIVSNYDEGGQLSQIGQLHMIESSLHQQQFCFSSLIIPNTGDATNKNPRFTAIGSGDYESVITTSKLPALKIIAYFGTSFEDFPNLKTNTALTLPATSSVFNKFGESYYLLPR